MSKFFTIDLYIAQTNAAPAPAARGCRPTAIGTPLSDSDIFLRMNYGDLLARLNDVPFRPFRMKLTNNTTYDVLDPIVLAYVEDDRTASEIVDMGFDEAVVRRVCRLVDLNEYKRRQCPPGVRVTPKAFGKDRRLPITNGYR